MSLLLFYKVGATPPPVFDDDIAIERIFPVRGELRTTVPTAERRSRTITAEARSVSVTPENRTR